MTSLSFYPAFFATFISIVGWTYLSWREHNPDNPVTLSVLAAAKKHTLFYFRTILWICGTLFAVTIFFFIIPRLAHGSALAIVWIITYTCEMLLGVFPARGTIEGFLHNILAFFMSFGMMTMGLLFIVNLHGDYAFSELVITVVMVVLATLALNNRKKFLVYELPFLFLSHISILVAAVSLK